jgi:hypothetical protein
MLPIISKKRPEAMMIPVSEKTLELKRPECRLSVFKV